MYQIIHSKIFLSCFRSSVGSIGSLNAQIVANLGSKNKSLRPEIAIFASVTVHSVPYPQVNTMQAKCMKKTSPKTFDKFPLQVVLNTNKVSFTGHSRPNTFEFMWNYINQ